MRIIDGFEIEDLRDLSEGDSSSNEENENDEDETNHGIKRKLESDDKSNKKAKRDLYKQPTTDELNQLKETEHLYSSSLMRLQIEELLSKINVPKKYVKKIELFWNDFQLVVKNIDDHLNLIKKKNLKLNLFDVKTDKEFKDVKFLKPKKFELFGLYKLNCMIQKTDDFNVNINVTIPSQFFQEKDYLNNRYLYKRNLYIKYLCVVFKKSKNWIPNICVYKNIKYCPYIKIQPYSDSNLTVNIFITADETSFKLIRCLPDKNNIKFHFDEQFNNININDFENDSTPLYNTMLARDWTLNINNNWLESKLNSKNIQDGIKLASVWLNLRELSNPSSGFTIEILLYSIAYLVEKRKINQHMSSYQIVRIFWHFLANSDWTKGICISDEVKPNNLKTFLDSFDVVFIDKSGFFNVCGFLDVDNYMMIKNEAQKALDLLDSNNFNCFTYLFNTKISFLIQFDAILKIHSHNIENILKEMSQEEKWKYYGFRHLLIIKKMKDLLYKGLLKRIKFLVPKNQFSHNSSTTQIIIFGITLDPINAFNTIERGPSSDDRDSMEEFRKFWGRFSDFRRFQDSTAGEVAVFPRETIRDRRNVFGTIIKYVLEEKFNLSIELIGNQFDEVITDKQTDSWFPMGTNEEASLKVKHISDDLTQKIRKLKLQLPINIIQGISTVFCYTDLFPPIPTNYSKKFDKFIDESVVFDGQFKSIPKYVYPIECVIQLSRSSAWPNELEALRAIKCEFYLKISELLKKEFKILSKVDINYLDVFYEGLLFRFKLLIQKEMSLLKRTVNSEGVTIYIRTEESFKLEKELEILPKIIGALNGVHQQYPSFGSSSTLIKRWLRSQMIDENHISDTTIDLWNASLFVNQTPFGKPNLPQIAFLRFLQHAANFDSETDFILTNFNEDIDDLKLNEFESNFINNRQSLPSLHIITPYDNGESSFTKKSPSLNILKRIRVLAEAAYNYLKDVSAKWELFDIRDLFKPNLDGYDIVIHLKSNLNPVKYQKVIFGAVEKRTTIEPYDKKISTMIPVIDFNPIQKFLRELREIYDKYALFFHDTYGGERIGILWIKTELEPKDFKTSAVNCRRLHNGKLELNIEAIIEDIYNRGTGLIKSIEKK